MSKHKAETWLAVALMAWGLFRAGYYAQAQDLAGIGYSVWVIWMGSGRFWPSARTLWWLAGGIAGAGGIVAWVATRSGGA